MLWLYLLGTSHTWSPWLHTAIHCTLVYKHATKKGRVLYSMRRVQMFENLHRVGHSKVREAILISRARGGTIACTAQVRPFPPYRRNWHVHTNKHVQKDLILQCVRDNCLYEYLETTRSWLVFYKWPVFYKETVMSDAGIDTYNLTVSRHILLLTAA